MGKIQNNYFKNLLSCLDFNETSPNFFKGCFGDKSYVITVDFVNEKIDYGADIKVNSHEICNFESNENLVVLECVCKLLKQGYGAKYIVLEPRWKVGHGPSGGKADIQVLDKSNKSYLIIECKTFGKEFETHWKTTLNDGGQLVSYNQQDQNTQYVALYASQFADERIESKYYLVSVIDNLPYLKTLGKKVKGYKDAKTAEEFFKVWKNIYNQDYDERGIFENNLPYNIGKSKLTTNDLEDVTSSSMYETDKKFKNILRQHNVGSHENAFDKLVNLFLAKIVDEKENKDDLQFNWRGTSKDDVKSLIDRLQKLYKQGMKDFLNEEVTYVEKKDIDNAFRFYNDDKDAIKETVLKYFDELKYYTNNDFAFLDVHNEKLFKQNAQILLKIVLMLQNLKLKTDNHNQFLGDLFEGFLDNGVKQSEGQYFTPLPIVRFIVSSLPLQERIKSSSKPLAMIDYACGAGHFLNEYANQISNIIHDEKTTREYFKNIYGVEKEYRLSKVSKVSAFMYSQDEINIIYDDALKHNRVKDNYFDVLIANPPYAVKGFLETLEDEDREKYELIAEINKKGFATNSSIETFFVERAKQLLVGDGIAAIILPASFLTNASIYVFARKILIEYFEIIAISEFASGTFGKTGTPTITLFLRRRKRNPETCSFVDSRIKCWFKKDFSHDLEFDDFKIVESFFKLLELDVEKFKSNPDNFKDYKEKLYLYYLVSLQKSPVVIIKSPVSNKELKKFLGYEWVNRNKSFKINYIGAEKSDDADRDFVSSKEGIDKIKTPLFNSKDLYDSMKINKVIKDNFENKPLIVPEHLTNFVFISPLSDLIKFKSSKFDLQISTTPVFKMKSKYDLIDLQKVTKFITCKQIQANELVDIIVDDATDIKLLPSSKDYGWFTTKENCPYSICNDEVIAIGQARYANIKYWKGAFVSANNQLVKSKDESKFKTKFLYHVFSVYSKHFYKRTGQYPAFNADLFNEFEIPNVSLDVYPDIQNNIVDECDKLDSSIDKAKQTILENQNKIIEIINISNDHSYKVNFDSDLEGNTGIRVLASDVDNLGAYPVISANINELFGWIDKTPKIKDFSRDFVLWGLDGDWMTRFMPKDKPFFPTDHCGWIQAKNISSINMHYLKYVLYDLGNRENFSRTKRPTIDRIKELDIRLPNIITQNETIEKIKPLEEKIEKLEEEMKSLPALKEKILDKYFL